MTRVTIKGQVTIPKEIREALGIEPGDAVVFLLDGERALLKRIRAQPLTALRGALASSLPYPGQDAIRQKVMRKVARQALKEEEA